MGVDILALVSKCFRRRDVGLPWLHVPLHFGVFTSLFYLGRGWGTWGFPVDAPCVAFTAGTLSCTSQGTVGICVGDFSQEVMNTFLLLKKKRHCVYGYFLSFLTLYPRVLFRVVSLLSFSVFYISSAFGVSVTQLVSYRNGHKIGEN